MLVDGLRTLHSAARERAERSKVRRDKISHAAEVERIEARLAEYDPPEPRQLELNLD